MKHKIPGVSIAECCKEQKIAYNIAFRVYIAVDEILLKSLSDPDKQAYIFDIIEIYRRDIGAGVDIDLAMQYLKNNIFRYLDSFFIASDYASIGQFFTL